jgi:hypothetical protein
MSSEFIGEEPSAKRMLPVDYRDSYGLAFSQETSQRILDFIVPIASWEMNAGLRSNDSKDLGAPDTIDILMQETAIITTLKKLRFIQLSAEKIDDIKSHFDNYAVAKEFGEDEIADGNRVVLEMRRYLDETKKLDSSSWQQRSLPVDVPQSFGSRLVSRIKNGIIHTNK